LSKKLNKAVECKDCEVENLHKKILHKVRMNSPKTITAK